MKKKYAKGTDNVQAVLTPREAVLNRNAAEILGRHNIAALNAHGNMLSKRGVDLASLPSDPTPGPSTENMLGYQYGTMDVEHEDQGESMMKAGYRFTPQDLAEMQRQRVLQGQVDRARIMNEKPRGYQGGTNNVGRDDRADLLRDADSTFYGGGGAPAPSPTPTPKPRRGYQYGTSSVDDYNPFSTALSGTGSAMFPTPATAAATSMASRYKLPTSTPNFGLSIDAGTLGGASSAIGSMFGPTAGAPAGGGGFAPFDNLTHTEMMTEIAKRNMQSLASPQPTQPVQQPDAQGYGSAFPATRRIGFSDLLSLSQGVPTRDPGLNLLNGVDPEETARYWKHIDDISRGRS